eukprot:TRINITY_DN15481_c0_g1_i1.p1 TRINITY_DN15481_c0_g1~~TRINITY_DN15481_c0_g1_i1.p1  ORF type:complete len:965 (+),score=245.26 TRINITY_DN15481_c0_g1_i1:84-2978(+)
MAERAESRRELWQPLLGLQIGTRDSAGSTLNAPSSGRRHSDSATDAAAWSARTMELSYLSALQGNPILRERERTSPSAATLVNATNRSTRTMPEESAVPARSESLSKATLRGSLGTPARGGDSGTPAKGTDGGKGLTVPVQNHSLAGSIPQGQGWHRASSLRQKRDDGQLGATTKAVCFDDVVQQAELPSPSRRERFKLLTITLGPPSGREDSTLSPASQRSPTVWGRASSWFRFGSGHAPAAEGTAKTTGGPCSALSLPERSRSSILIERPRAGASTPTGGVPERRRGSNVTLSNEQSTRRGSSVDIDGATPAAVPNKMTFADAATPALGAARAPDLAGTARMPGRAFSAVSADLGVTAKGPPRVLSGATTDLFSTAKLGGRPPTTDSMTTTAGSTRNLGGSRRLRSLTLLFDITPAVVLRTFGVARLRVLHAAFLRLSQREKPELDRASFRNLWRCVFPDRPVDEAVWQSVEQLYTEIDEYATEAVGPQDVLHCLHVYRHVAAACPTARPLGAKQWAWLLCRPDPVPCNWANADSEDWWAVTFAYLWKGLAQLSVLLSIAVLMVESLPEMQREDDVPGSTATAILETFCVAVFTVDFVLMLWSYPPRSPPASGEEEDDDRDTELEEAMERSMTAHSASNAVAQAGSSGPKYKWRYLLTEFSFWVDFTSILPFYLSNVPRFILGLSEGGDGEGGRGAAPLAAVRLLRLLRLLRIFRILRLGRGKFGKMLELGAAMRRSLVSLNFLFCIIVIVICISASFAYYAELAQASFDFNSTKWVRHEDSEYVDAGEPTHFQSIAEGLWWAVVTITTVGYGDMHVRSAGGQIIGAITLFAGIHINAFPITILNSSFQALNQADKEKRDRGRLCAEFYSGLMCWVDQGTPIRKMDKDKDVSRTGLPAGGPGGVFQREPERPGLSMREVRGLQQSVDSLSSSVHAAVAAFRSTVEAQLQQAEERVARLEAAM